MPTPKGPTIQILSADLASQIAAGEVVERPASVVKELIENALDAGARRIDVTIEAGGLGLIEVADDGRGMSAMDAPLSLGRHATSKLRRFEDLQELSSYGFRGEALPSVASVSRLEIRTRASDSDEGVVVSAQGTTEPQLSPVGHPVGTTLVVRDLFFNVPARRKFLRSSNTESGHVAEVVIDAALSNPEVSFSLTRDKRKVKQFARTEQRRVRAEQVFAETELWQVSGARGPLTLDAFLCPPERSQKGAAGLKLLINGRPIRDRALAATIAHAFGSLLERGRYPRGVVYLEMPARLVDVNVHPQKTEVRFAEQRAVTDAIYGLVARAVSGKWMAPVSEERMLAPRAPSVGMASSPRGASRPGSSPTGWSGSLDTLGQPGQPGQPGQLGQPGQPGAEPPSSSEDGMRAQGAGGSPASAARRAATPRLLRDGAPPVSGSRYEALGLGESGHLVATRGGRDSRGGDLLERQHQEHDASFGGKSWKNLRFLCQVRSMYLVCEGPDGIYVLDQHAADERVLFSRLKKSYETSSVASQALLFPLSVEVTPTEAEILERRAQDIKALGLDVRVRSRETVSIHSVPKLLQRTSPERLLRDLLTELSRESQRGFSALVDQALSTMACHEAVRAGDRLNAKEAEALLRSLDGADFDSDCPHGRPVVAITTFKDLERKVGRR